MAKYALVTRFTYFNEDEPLYDTKEEAIAAATEMLNNDPTKPVRIDEVVTTLVGKVTVSEMDGDDASSGSDESEPKTLTKKA